MKKTYLTPSIKTRSIVETESILAASGETMPIGGEQVNEGLSKQSGAWEAEQSSVWDD